MIPLPLLAIAAGAALALMDVRNATLDKANEADTLRERMAELERQLNEARESDDSAERIAALESDLQAARRELAGLKAGAEARNAKPPKADPPADDPPNDDADDEDIDDETEPEE